MKIYSKERCSACNTDVEFEFEDVEFKLTEVSIAGSAASSLDNILNGVLGF